MIDFAAVEEDIRVSAGDVFSPVWTMWDGDTPEDISDYTFEFDVIDARTGEVAASALCTVLVDEDGQVQTTIDLAEEDLNPRHEYRYKFRLLSLGEPVTLATGRFIINP